MYGRYFQGWAAGLEFGKLNPRAATQIVMEQFPGLASQMSPAVATESMMQLANVFSGRWDERKKWGFHIMDIHKHNIVFEYMRYLKEGWFEDGAR